ncbi:MAG: acetyl-CoA carboxylase biotin carboxyl carrier protein subunit [Polyangiaceae bacterium]
MAKVIKAHITGNIWKIEAKVGDEISEGTVVSILESMKMEMPVEAEEDGIITAVLVKEGDPIKEGAPMFEYDAK